MSKQTKAWLEQRTWEVLQHPLYSPDLARSDFQLLGPLKKFFAGKCFEDQKDLQNTVLEYFKQLDRQQYHEVMLKRVPCWDKCLNVYENYVEK
ncbi:hypothetical protein AVEN_125608-1 [Araneus ventricosus]|uniref:Histone-lysine N-methyltransferase SETMAR n=1 Tax=Araneus ventricosus TaxID=182803 RepID=A0A4Y2RCF1_ARAVE|nr:hypothetical protein AVEN_125608-1 [Araneus ventricosus]